MHFPRATHGMCLTWTKGLLLSEKWSLLLHDKHVLLQRALSYRLCSLVVIYKQFSNFLSSSGAKRAFPLSCSADLICWPVTLFSTDRGSLHALQNSLPQFLHRCSPGNPLIRSDVDTFEGSLEAPPFPFFIPFGGLLELFPFLDR